MKVLKNSLIFALRMILVNSVYFSFKSLSLFCFDNSSNFSVLVNLKVKASSTVLLYKPVNNAITAPNTGKVVSSLK